ncbi:MAG: S-layer homology domain-containing protein [Oscillospiraceae bacterium]|nr:S-layer homology domain-containing protein [Oscillospiraceae bacterium]
MRKRIVSILLCVCILASCIPAVSAYSGVASWASEAVSEMDALGFLPSSLQNADMSKPITRGEMCQMAVLVYGHLLAMEPYPDSTGHFSDTKDASINFAYEQGIVAGYEDGTFRPNNNLLRQDFFKIVHNMMGAAYWTAGDLELISLDRFSDAGKVSDYAVEAARVMVTLGIVQGDGKNLNPRSNTTRQEAILMFFRAYKYMCDWINAQTLNSDSFQLESSGYSGISSWAIREVAAMDELGLIPERMANCNMSGNITRAEMCAIAALAYQKATGETATPQGSGYFTDCDDPDVNLAYELGLINGYPNGTVRPNSTLTREEFFMIMSNFMGVVGYPRKDSVLISLSNYKDGKNVGGWAQAATRLLIYIGAVNGDGSYLNPKKATTIEEAVAIFLRCYKFTVAWTEAHPDGELYEEPEIIEELLAFAKRYEDYPYVYGGNGPNYFDCSGFVLYVYKHFGYSFSRGAQDQYWDGEHVDYEDLRPGDLVFFSGYSGYNHTNSSIRNVTHVGLYLGDGKFIHAANPSRGVVIDTLLSGYYYTHYWGACRIITDEN